jgi:hypothetical protein
MSPELRALAATLQALRGETDPHIVAPALRERQFARVLAFAPGVKPVISALGAPAGGLPDGIPPAVHNSSALAAAVAPLIGTDAGDCIVVPWAKVAPTGWGSAYAAALIDAV